MQIFLTGANGFIGGAVAATLIAQGHGVRGMVRDRMKADAVALHGVEPVIGSLDDVDLLRAEAHRADGVVNAASSDHRAAVEALVSALEGSGKPLLHTSGSSIVADEAMGEPSDRTYDEETPIRPEPDKVARVALDRRVLEAPGVRSIVLCNSMIYGHALGAPAESVQVPALVHQARSSGVARYIGRGLNRWSNVHIADVAALYALALEKAPAGTFLYVESGEESLGNIVGAPNVSSWATLSPCLQRMRSRFGDANWQCSPLAPIAGCAGILPGSGWVGLRNTNRSLTGLPPSSCRTGLGTGSLSQGRHCIWLQANSKRPYTLFLHFRYACASGRSACASDRRRSNC